MCLISTNKIVNAVFGTVAKVIVFLFKRRKKGVAAAQCDQTLTQIK
jgi:hypothetical protein